MPLLPCPHDDPRRVRPTTPANALDAATGAPVTLCRACATELRRDPDGVFPAENGRLFHRLRFGVVSAKDVQLGMSLSVTRGGLLRTVELVTVYGSRIHLTWRDADGRISTSDATPHFPFFYVVGAV